MSDDVKITWDADSILAFLESHRDELRAMGVQKIGLFGSYARGEQKADSDMDFLGNYSGRPKSGLSNGKHA
jgi:uncharacterized protein